MELYVLPKDCIADILSRTSPQDVCRLSVVSTIFRSVADSDSVWEKFLPSNIELILSSSVSSSLPNFSSKKKLFFHLCDNPLLIDNGTKTFALEKCSGKKCYMIGAKELSIVRDDDIRSYWIWSSLPESRSLSENLMACLRKHLRVNGLMNLDFISALYRFSEVAKLVLVRRLDLCGRMETRLLSPDTTYVAYLVLKFKRTVSGFDSDPVELSVKLASDNHAEVTSVCLTRPVVEGFRELPEETDADSGSEGEVPEETEADPGSEREVREEIEADSGLEGEISEETEAEGEVPEETGADSGPEEEVSDETEADLRLEGEVSEETEADSGSEGEVPEETEADSQLEGEITEDTESDLRLEGEEIPIISERILQPTTSVPERKVVKERGDGWMEIRMGEFFNERGEDGEVEMSLREIKNLGWKSGIIIEGIELRPKDNQ